MADNQLALSAVGIPKAPAKAMYTRLESQRWVTLERARDCSYVTLPALIPSQWVNDFTEIPEPFQSLGARGVNNLTSKLMLTLFPPGQPWLRLMIREQIKPHLGDGVGDYEQILSQIEHVINDKLEELHFRPLLTEMLKHLMVGGTTLLHVPDKGKPRFFRLDQHVIVRDAMDRPLEVLVKEVTVCGALHPDVCAACKVDRTDHIRQVEIYTRICWDHNEKKVHYWQEINDHEVPDSRGWNHERDSEWIPLRWVAVPGRDYGRGQVEEYLGDLRSLEELSECIVQFATAAAKIVALVHPNATTSVVALNQAESGDAIVGSKADIDILQLEKQQDFQVVVQTCQRLEERLSYSFLLQTGTTRQAERVTAEEIRQTAQELEDALGGVYTVLAQELQLPLATRLMKIAQKQKEIPVLPDETLNLRVVTGFEALGRNRELNGITAMMQQLAELLTPQVLAQRVNTDELVKRFGAGYGVEQPNQLFKSNEQVAQEQQQEQMNQTIQKAAPAAAGPLMEHALGQAGGGSQSGGNS